MNKRLIVILGPTSSGKSDTAIELAATLGDCAIVNCDSRQIYKKLNLGTGKIKGKWELVGNQKIFTYQNQPHYLIDYVDPSVTYSLTQYLIDFNQLIHKLPQYNIILVGGTGLYADAIINTYQIPLLSPAQEIEFIKAKKELDKFSLNQLQNIFQEEAENKINESDYNNPRRLINQILKSRPQFRTDQFIPIPDFQSKHIFAIDIDKEALHQNIKTRLDQRFQEGLIQEVKGLRLSSQRLQALGLEYRLVDDFLQDRINEKDLLPKMLTKNTQYAKRQITWLRKRNPIWVKSAEDISKYK